MRPFPSLPEAQPGRHTVGEGYPQGRDPAQGTETQDVVIERWWWDNEWGQWDNDRAFAVTPPARPDADGLEAAAHKAFRFFASPSEYARQAPTIAS